MNMSREKAEKFDVIIPVKDRIEVMQCVQSLTPAIAHIASIIVCDGGSSDAQCLRVLHELEQVNHVRVLYFPAPGFNKSRLINKGISQATSDCLLISDADIIWNEATLEVLLTNLSATETTLYYIQDVEESNPQSVALKRDRYTYNIQINDNVAFVDIRSESILKSKYRPGCGLICTHRNLLLALGGYKEIFQGWGWEDQDLLIRAILFGMQIVTAGKVMHISHEDSLRNKHFGNVEPVQTRNRNIIASLKSLSQGSFQGDLCREDIQPQAKLIYVHLPESLSWNIS